MRCRFISLLLTFFLPVTVPAFAAPRTNTPDMSYLDNGVIRLGVDLNLGGAITFLSKSKSDLNLINSWDWGRQVQMSYYSGPVPFTPGGKQPAPEWKGLGWNPVQAGDHFGNASKTIEHANDGKTIHIKCVPMQWPLDHVPLEGTFEAWYSLDGEAVKVRSRLNNARSDKTQWPARTQELPAVYTNAPFYKLMTYTGDKPFSSAELSRIDHQMKPREPWAHWYATENWAALLNDDGWGLGVWNPDCFNFSGGAAGKPGKGGPKDSSTNYIAPNRAEILDHNIVHEYQYTLILGDLATIRKYVYDHAKRPAPPTYRFEKDRQGWHYRNATDTGWPINGQLNVQLDGDDPQLVGPPGFWQAADAPVLYLHAAFQTGQKSAQIFWSRLGEKGMSRIDLAIVPDGAYRTYEIHLADSPAYKGIITGLRFDPVPAAKKGEWVKVKWIGFEKVK
jgi:hypothetical protein